jgi:hypothetical protein
LIAGDTIWDERLTCVVLLFYRGQRGELRFVRCLAVVRCRGVCCDYFVNWIDSIRVGILKVGGYFVLY